MTKTYIFSDGKKAAFEYDENGVGKITLECMNMLMGQLIAYKWCIQSRSFWDSKHCDGCMFYDDCPFDPREDEDEPQTDNGIGCSKCESRFWCMDRDMPHAVHCNNYGKTEQTERKGE